MFSATIPLVLLGACGGDDEGNDDADAPDTSSTAPGTPSESASPTEVDPGDQAIAEAALLTLQDFPPGWEASPADEEDDDARENREFIATCMGVDYDDLYNDSNAKADSPDFTSENDEELSVSVQVDSSEESMATAFELASRPEYRECVAEGLSDILEEQAEEADEDVEIGELTLNELSAGSFGDDTVAFRATVPMEVQGFNLDVTMEFVVVRVGRAQTGLTTLGVGSNLSTEEFIGYVELAVKRLEDALAASE